MPVRGIRGAICVTKDDPKKILFETSTLIGALLESNPTLQPQDIAAVIFSMTTDLNSVYPAQAAREMGWKEVPLMCVQEIPVKGSLPFCIRILILWNTDLPQSEIHPVYLGNAKVLRPDLI